MKNNLKPTKWLLTALAFGLTPMVSFASAWHLLWSVNSEYSGYFFDSETVEKQNEYRSVWIKTVRKRSPDADGAWASSSRYKINCKNKTYRILSVSDYDLNNRFIKSYPSPSEERSAPPDSVAEAILVTVCKSSFPNDSSEKSDYWKLPDNDVFSATRKLREWDDKKFDKAPI